MDNQTIFLALIAVFVAISAAAMIFQAAMLYGTYKASRELRDRIVPLTVKVDALVESSRSAVDEARIQMVEITTRTNQILDVARQQMETAQLQEATGDLAAAEKSYAAIVAADPNALLALRGLARVAEARGDLAGAKAHWAEYTKKSRAGDAGWFQGEYQQARLEVAAGDKKAACKRLDDLRPAMPALTDADMRKELTTLYDQACK